MDLLRMTRCPSVRLEPDPTRVITKPFVPREEVYADGSTRLQTLLLRVIAMSDEDVRQTLDDARLLFAGRHRDLEEVFERYNRASDGTAIVENRYLQTVAVRA